MGARHAFGNSNEDSTSNAPFVAYLRVSTDKQGRSDLDLEEQEQAIRRFIKHRGTLIAQFTEIESGKTKERPELIKAVALSKRKKATLLIARLDKLARNVSFISSLMESHADFVACDMPKANRLTIHILAAVAEYEREVISKRTKNALQLAKKKGKKLGNPQPEKALILAGKAIQTEADRFASFLRPYVEFLLQKGHTYAEVAREFNAKGIPTARKRFWYSTTVKNLHRRKVSKDTPT